MIFEWNHAKAASNLVKHGVDFDDAAHVLLDPFALELQQVFEGEERWRMVGMVNGHLLAVVIQFKERNGEQIVRLISARRATRHERKNYHETHRT